MTLTHWLLLASMLSGSAHAIEQDKMLHATVSYAGTVTLARMLQDGGSPSPEIAAAATMMILGLMKEGMDYTSDPGDIAANAVGCTAGLLFSWSF